MDFYRIVKADPDKKGVVAVFPDYTPNGFSDLMIRGGEFYAIWDAENNTWSTDEYDVPRLVDEDLRRHVQSLPPVEQGRYDVKWMNSFNSNSWVKFKSFIRSVSDRYTPLDRRLVFLDETTTKDDYVTKSLPYKLEDQPCPAWDELISLLYSPLERQKIEWAIGSIISGESRDIQKFLVFYGSPGTGKSTIINVIEKLFQGYFSTFEAKALGANNGAFSTAAFKHNPLVAIQHDGDLSRIEDNTKLNSIIAHEYIRINEKFQSEYEMKIDTFLFMGTNKPVKISDSKSGLVRRLIDVHPTGERHSIDRYNILMNQINFELGAIANHCLQTYLSLGKSYYNAYRPVEMMSQTDYFYNFVANSYDIFEEQGGVTTNQAWRMFKEFCEDQKIDAKMPQFKFREELKNYFTSFEQRAKVDGQWVWGWYSGFDKKAFVQHDTPDTKSELPAMGSDISILDEVLEALPAQYGRTDKHGNQIPEKRWDNVTTTLKDIDTKQLHYVKVPPNMIVVDFDIKDPNGEKSLELNLEAASQWPETYGELSKSGEGVHLHYMYDGDPEELAREFDKDIEIKVFTGNSSLRRKLSRCNNTPIATISSGLPLKEKKKMLAEDTIKSERGLRDLVERNLQKQVHPGTKPSIDFIHHILEEAYDGGVVYDLTDMKSRIIKFALSSTHQSARCLEIVDRMKFKSEHDEFDADKPETKESRLVFFDLEVYKNLFAIGWKFAGDSPVVRMVNPTATEVEALFKMKLVGFNNRKYDNHILYAASLGYSIDSLYKLSQRIIANVPNSTFGEAYNLSYTDVYDYASEKMTLKKWEIELGISHIEMDIPWDQPVPDDRLEDVLTYMENDVLATEAVHNARQGDYKARLILADLSGLTPNHTTNQHSGAIIFGKNKRPQPAFKYTDLSVRFPGYKFDAGKSYYRDEIVGEGGYVYAEPGIYENVALLDVASMHPTSIEQLNLFGDEYTKKFSDMKAARVAIKRGDHEMAGQLLDGKLKKHLGDKSEDKALSDALKIVINSVYGLTSASFDNVFRDPRNKDNIVAKRGALFMIDLKHAVQERGFTVAHIKTDSIKIPNATPEIIDFVEEFGRGYGYEFEHEATYEKFALVNDAVYVARQDGNWSATGAQFQHPYVFKTMFSGEEIEFEDLFEAKSVQKGSMYLNYDWDLNLKAEFEPGELQRFVGRTGLFVPVMMGTGGGELFRVHEKKLYKISGTTGYLWKEAKVAQWDDVDMRYYEKLVEKATSKIEEFGKFEELIK